MLLALALVKAFKYCGTNGGGSHGAAWSGRKLSMPARSLSSGFISRFIMMVRHQPGNGLPAQNRESCGERDSSTFTSQKDNTFKANKVVRAARKQNNLLGQRKSKIKRRKKKEYVQSRTRVLTLYVLLSMLFISTGLSHEDAKSFPVAPQQMKAADRKSENNRFHHSYRKSH